MLGRLYNNYRLSEAAVIVQNLLELHGRGSAVARNSSTIASKLVDRVFSGDPELFEGKRGKRPHKFSIAAVALAQGVRVMADEPEGKLCFRLALGTVLLEVTGKPHQYALTGNDHLLLELAQEVYLATASTPAPDANDEPRAELLAKTSPPPSLVCHPATMPVPAAAPKDPAFLRRSEELGNRIAALRGGRG